MIPIFYPVNREKDNGFKESAPRKPPEGKMLKNESKYDVIIDHLKYYAFMVYLYVYGSYILLLDNLNNKYNKMELPQMTGRIAVVTGGSRGIGFETVRKLLLCDMEVIMACKNCTAGEEAVKRIRDSGVKSGVVKVLELDNASLKSVKNFADKFKEDYERLDILINNAGVMFTPQDQWTQDNFEPQYGINYLSHFYLTSLLLPCLNTAGSPERCSRVINVTSAGYTLSKIYFDDLNFRKNRFKDYLGYSQSKRAQILFTKYTASLFKLKNLPIKMYAVHPGVVRSGLFTYYAFSPMRIISKLFYRKPVDGATSIVFAAVTPTIEEYSGLYITSCMVKPVESSLSEISIQYRLYKVTLKQLNMTDFFQYL